MRWLVGFFLGLLLFSGSALAFNACDVVGQTLNCNGWILTDWSQGSPMFSPAPLCNGTVTLVSPQGKKTVLDYVGTYSYITIAGVQCQPSPFGMACKIITVPEQSYIIRFKQEQPDGPDK